MGGTRSVASDCVRLHGYGKRYTDGGERSVTPGGTTNIRQALKGRQNNLPQLTMTRCIPSPFQG
ncbi:MAG: hypothetical protein IKR48_03240, partial [Kiritimatiellae bacterium]|nr:hypothetical protein [Kiritimatiellia bacterium]